MKTIHDLVIALTCFGWAESYFVDLTIESLVLSNNSKSALFGAHKNFKVIKFNRTHQAIAGSVDVLRDIDENFNTSVEFYHSQGNEYRLTPFKLQSQQFCEFLAESNHYPDVVAVSDLPPQGTCPLPKDTYTIQNYFIDTSRFYPNFVGRYRIRALLYCLEELIDEINLYVDIEYYVVK